MVLSPHSILGAIIATEVSRSTNQAVLGIILAFFSHFLLDAIPHWDYLISSLKKVSFFPLGKLIKTTEFWRDVLFVALDLIICFSIIAVFWKQSQYFIVAINGAFAAILPDLFQFLYWFFPSSFLLQKFKKFHHQFHASKKPKNKLLGILWQVTFTVLIIVVAFILNKKK